MNKNPARTVFKDERRAYYRGLSIGLVVGGTFAVLLQSNEAGILTVIAGLVLGHYGYTEKNTGAKENS